MPKTIAKSKKRSKPAKAVKVPNPVPTRRFFKFDAKFGRTVEITEVPAERIVSQYPKTPFSIAVHRSQTAEIEKMVRAKTGRHVEHDRHGRPIFNSRRDENAYLRARGLANLDPGYSDVAPNRFDQKVEYN